MGMQNDHTPLAAQTGLFRTNGAERLRACFKRFLGQMDKVRPLARLQADDVPGLARNMGGFLGVHPDSFG